MPRRRRVLVAVLALATVAAAVALGFALLRPSGRAATVAAIGTSSARFVPPAKREPLPPLRGETLAPPPASLAFRDLRGRPAFLTVWASWCKPCREEAPTMARLAHEFAPGVRFVGIDVQDRREDGLAFVRRYRLGFPHVFDPRLELATKLGVYGVPTVFLVDRQGRIAATLIGRQTEALFRRALTRLAAERT